MLPYYDMGNYLPYEGTFKSEQPLVPKTHWVPAKGPQMQLATSARMFDIQPVMINIYVLEWNPTIREGLCVDSASLFLTHAFDEVFPKKPGKYR